MSCSPHLDANGKLCARWHVDLEWEPQFRIGSILTFLFNKISHTISSVPTFEGRDVCGSGSTSHQQSEGLYVGDGFGVKLDQTARGFYARKDYPDKLSRIKFYDELNVC